jgi:hypothetical protein
MTLLPLCLLPPPSRTGKSGAKLLSITGMEEELDPKPPATAGARVGGGGLDSVAAATSVRGRG